jgi:hypothetical protein
MVVRGCDAVGVTNVDVMVFAFLFLFSVVVLVGKHVFVCSFGKVLPSEVKYNTLRTVGYRTNYREGNSRRRHQQRLLAGNHSVCRRTKTFVILTAESQQRIDYFFRKRY